MPSNEDRGYVLRRIMRRAIRFGVKLNLEGAFLHQVTDTVVEEMGGAYPELFERRSYIRELVESEERRFAETLHRGLSLLEQAIDALGEDPTLPGQVAFKLYDTYGFPLDLTRQVAGERGITVDEPGFDAEMAEQKARGRAAWKGTGSQTLLQVDGGLGTVLSETHFLGYDRLTAQSEMLALLHDGAGTPTLTAGQSGTVIVAESPFYAESGGQAADHGVLRGPEGRFRVTDVQKGQGGLFFHHGEVVDGELAIGQGVVLEVDQARRDAIRLNHTATHLLHAALRNVLGSHVAQKGSLVDADRLRFDFSHHKSVTAAQLQSIEDQVFVEVLANTGLETQVMDLDAAKDAGAMALFGEKYASKVRVVRIGDYSSELCGGTHVQRTGDIGLFRLMSENGIAAGVRRIEAVTGLGAMRWSRQRDRAASAAAARLRTPVEDLAEAIDRGTAERKRLEKEIEGLRRELARNASGDLAAQARDVGGIQVVAAEIPGDASTLREEADRIRDTLGSGVVVLGSRSGGKVIVVATASKDLAGKRIHAGNLVREVAKLVGGGGGGRPDMAQAGGRNPDALPGALAKVFDMVAAQL
jgi:alanyl-tRNA synthetase